MGIQSNDDGSVTLFHWGDSETYRNLAVVRLNVDGSYRGGVCLSNSANGPAIFRQMIEPVVGQMDAIASWLQKREGLQLSASTHAHISTKDACIQRTQRMREAVSNIQGDTAQQPSSATTYNKP